MKDKKLSKLEERAIIHKETEKAIFASGCFWGTQYHFSNKKGVLATIAGYTGGKTKDPSYEQVCNENTGHAEAVEITFDSSEISYEELCKLYFETHDFTQINRQGPDIGKQYRSEIFYLNDSQKNIAEKLVKSLTDKGYKVATKISKASVFWKAEKYHQNYYEKKGGTPYCHIYKKIF